MVKLGSGVKHLRKMPNWSERIWERYEQITGKPRPPMFQPRKDSHHTATGPAE